MTGITKLAQVFFADRLLSGAKLAQKKPKVRFQSAFGFFSSAAPSSCVTFAGFAPAFFFQGPRC